jgi:hypothetical protein
MSEPPAATRETTSADPVPSPNLSSDSTSEASLKQGSEAFSNQIFTLIGHEDVADITFLQADMCVNIFSICHSFMESAC